MEKRKARDEKEKKKEEAKKAADAAKRAEAAAKAGGKPGAAAGGKKPEDKAGKAGDKVAPGQATPGKPPAAAAGADGGEAGVNRSLQTLMDVSFSVKRGQLIAVVGSVGSGKSSLLSGLLGELNLTKGAVRVCGSVAYCDQRPWIMNTTVRDNILFGQPYDERRFDLAVHASSLEDDIKVGPPGRLAGNAGPARSPPPPRSVTGPFRCCPAAC